MKKQLLALLLLGSLAFAIQPAESWNVISTGKYAPTGNANVTTEGGNVTNLDLAGNISTEKWAGYWGNVTGQIVLSPGSAPLFYQWAWDSGDGGEVCAIAAASGFDWANVQATAGAAIDGIWGFSGTDTDSAASTLTESCSVDVAGTPVAGSAGITTNGAAFQTCAVADGAAPAAKSNIAFCVNITQGGTLFNTLAGDYQLLAPADETAGTTETHYFWIELD